ncbi:MAG: hypothetical protein U0931_35775 [Vulcanimicrobiota bacterium]
MTHSALCVRRLEGKAPQEQVVLLHSSGMSSRQWRQLPPALEGRFQTHAPDLAQTMLRSSLVCLPEAGHMGPLTHAAAFNQLVLSHLTQPLALSA